MKIVKKSKLLILSGVFILITTFNMVCENAVQVSSPSSYSEAKLGFIAATSYAYEKMKVSFISTAIPEEIPKIVVNKKSITPTFSEPSWWDAPCFLTWGIDDIESDTTVTYVIEYKGITLSGFFTIPAAVTEVMCNGVQISETQTIENADSYVFSWTASDAKAFRFSYELTYLLKASGEDDWDHYSHIGHTVYPTTNKLSVTPSTIGQPTEIWFEILPLNSVLQKEGNVPDASSSNVFIYYDIHGVGISSRIDISSS